LRYHASARQAPVHVVAARLGHADPSITLRGYPHVINEQLVEGADIFARQITAARPLLANPLARRPLARGLHGVVKSPEGIPQLPECLALLTDGRMCVDRHCHFDVAVADDVADDVGRDAEVEQQ
jgi:hypothetical protein